MRLTLAGLLSRLQAVARRAHAGPGGRGGGETELGAVAIVVAAQVDTCWRGKVLHLDSDQTENKTTYILIYIKYTIYILYTNLNLYIKYKMQIYIKYKSY